MGPRECGAAAGLALIAHRRGVLAQIHGVLLGDVRKGGRQRLRRHRIALRRNRHFQIVPIDAGVARHQQLEHGLRYHAERDQPAFALKQLNGVRSSGSNLIEALVEGGVLVRLETFVDLLLF